MAQLSAYITDDPSLLQRTDNAYGRTLLYMASWNGHFDVVEMLLDRGAGKDKANKGGWTPLMIAAYCGHSEVVELLLRRDALLYLRLENGKTALDIAREEGYLAIVDLMRKVRAWGPSL